MPGAPGRERVAQRARVLRIVTLNLWNEQGPWADRLALAQEQLAALAPDIVLLQEVRERATEPGPVTNQAETLATGLGLSMTHEVAQPWGDGDEGVAILSRFPIVERAAVELPFTEGRSRRVCLGAALETPWGRAWAFTTHLAYRLIDGALRERQVVAVDRFVREHAGGDGAAILGGDFNATPDSDEMRYLRGLTSLDGGRTYYQDAFAAMNPGLAGHTWTRENPFTEALAWLEPDRRLDYVYVTSMRRDGAGRVEGSRIVCHEPDAAGMRCSDHFGVLADVQVFADDTGAAEPVA